MPLNTRPSALGDVLATVDAAAGTRVVVVGSVPPGARDLDLLVPDTAVPRVEQALEAAGYARRGSTWARFHDCVADAVEVVPTGTWGLASAVEAGLFDAASPLPECEHIASPAPHHTLLILSRQLGRGPLPAKRRRRLEDALARDPNAWERAREEARAWDLEARLARLERVVAEETSSRAVLRRPRLGHVVALSGLDGAGKSTQAEHLRDALGALGYDAVVIWTPLASNTSLIALAAPVKWALRTLQHRRGGSPVPRAEGRSLIAVPDAGEGGMAKTALMLVWATVVALVNAVAQARRAAPHLARGRIVIFDRFLLDSAVHLRYLYGAERRFRLQEALLRRLAPGAVAAFFLDVEPEIVSARKPLQYDLAQLQQQAELYRANHERFGVRRVDGAAALEDVCRELAVETWRRLPA